MHENSYTLRACASPLYRAQVRARTKHAQTETEQYGFMLHYPDLDPLVPSGEELDWPMKVRERGTTEIHYSGGSE